MFYLPDRGFIGVRLYINIVVEASLFDTAMNHLISVKTKVAIANSIINLFYRSIMVDCFVKAFKSDLQAYW